MNARLLPGDPSLLARLRQSPTFATWGSNLVRGVGQLGVLVLALRFLDPAEMAVWQMLLVIRGIQFILDFGFSATFSRVIAFAMGGARQVADLRALPERDGPGPVWPLLESITSTMGRVYLGLSSGVVLICAIFGSLALLRPIGAAESSSELWLAWALSLAVGGVRQWGTIHVSYLLGVDEVARLRWGETGFGLAGALAMAGALLGGFEVLGVVVADALVLLANVVFNIYLCRRVQEGRWSRFGNPGFDRQVFRQIWPSVWRSGLGMVLYSSVVQASGLIYAQVGQSAAVAAYLVALRLLNQVMLFGQAPFYSRLPLLARLRAEGRLEDQIAAARRSMALAQWTLVAGLAGLAVLATPLLDLIGSQTRFVDPELWALMALAAFFERHGAMHLHFYSTTNHIIWHVANGVTGLLFLAISLALLPSIGVYAFPAAMLASTLLFYWWYSLLHSYRSFRMRVFEFEGRASLPQLVVLSVFLLAHISLVS